MAVGIVYDEQFIQSGPVWYHDKPDRVVLSRERLQAIPVEGGTLWDSLVPISAHEAPRPLLELVHQPTYVDEIAMLSDIGGEELDHETLVCPWTYQAAAFAAGGVVAATSAVVRSELDSVFCLTRPPGHQAMVDRAAGGCIFNTAAIAAMFALQNLDIERVAIIDVDPRHGSGTQKAFFTTRSVLYCSIHQYPLPPGTGALEEVGAADGRGYTINFPLPVGARDEHVLHCFEDVIRPVLLKLYQPGLIIISAGFGGHYEDHSTDLRLTENCYHAITRIILDCARELDGTGVCCILEGAYDGDPAPLCTENMVRALCDLPPTSEVSNTTTSALPEASSLDADVASVIAFHAARLGGD